MTYFTERPAREQEIITLAYEFEKQAIENLSTERNPWFDDIKTWVDGKAVWEGINEAIEMCFN